MNRQIVGELVIIGAIVLYCVIVAIYAYMANKREGNL